VVSDLLEHTHAATVARTLGPDATRLPNDQAQRMTALGAAVSPANLARAWQMLLKAYDEVRRAPDPAAATEMALVRICYASDLPGPEEALKRLQSGQPLTGGGGGGPQPVGGGPSGGGPRAQVQMRPAAAPLPPARPQSFEEVVALIGDRRDIKLKLDVEQFIRLVSFRPGAIEFEPAPGCPLDLSRRLSQKLKEWTGQTWLIAAQGGGGAESLYEREKREAVEAKARLMQDPFVVGVMQAFPGAEVVGVRRLAVEPTAAPTAGATGEDEDED
jgi:DNA polymerase-3 subunit gamma/tau